MFLSPSEVPGEGEVKLLEWIYKKPRRGESIAILSGDSDLVLEALVIPIHSTHNVFVIWPGSAGTPSKSVGNKIKASASTKHYVCVCLYETTRRLQDLIPNLSFRNLMRVRTDLVLLLILNGNDYLPKLRGSSGFNKLFGQYVRMQRERVKQDGVDPLYLVDPDSLEFDVDTCIDFFQRLAAAAPRFLPKDHGPKQKISSSSMDQRQSSLQQLQNFVDAGYLPGPLRFLVVESSSQEVVNGDCVDSPVKHVNQDALAEQGEDEAGGGIGDESVDDDDDEEGEEDDDNEADYGRDEDVEVESEKESDEVLWQLQMGEPSTEDSYLYEMWFPLALPRKGAKQQLARMALEDLLDFDEEGDSGDESLDSPNNGGYDWELRHSVESKIESYLYGLLWNLQTYQDGICADYSWNYGKRRSPTANEVLNFFIEAKANNEKVGLLQLRSGPFSPPLSAGAACLAALPCSEKRLVPEPYRYLAEETVEEIYGACMDKEDNTFDSLAFERICNEYVSGLPLVNGIASNEKSDAENRGRRILMSDHLWTVVSKVGAPLTHPFDPPLPFSDRLSKLRPNNRIRISKVMSIQQPRPREAWGDKFELATDGRMKHRFTEKDRVVLSHTDPAPFMIGLKSLDDLDFKKAYPRHAYPRRSTTTQKSEPVPVQPSTPLVSFRTKDGLSSLACLNQLQDGGFVGMIQWEESLISENRERVRLLVRRTVDPKFSVFVNDLSFEKERDKNMESKKAVKQHLAALALCEIMGSKNWSEYTFKDLTRTLKERSPDA